MNSIAARRQWLNWAGLIIVPLAVMAAAVLLVWAPVGGPSKSMLALPWPYVIGLGGGLVFARRVVRGRPVVRSLLLAAYVLMGILVLSWFTLVLNCGRGVCL